MIKHIFFDLDRTLWDFEKNSHETLLELYQTHNLSDLGIDDVSVFISDYKRINESLWCLYRQDKISQEQLRTERFQKTLAEYNIIDPELAERIGEDYIEVCPRKVTLYPYVFEILEYLKIKYQLHIITNGFHKTQQIKLKYSNLRPYFNQIITSEQVGVKKPNPKIFEYALFQSEAISNESLYIGDDLEVDIIACQNVGIDGVYFNPEKKTHNQEPKFEVSCLSQLKDIL